MDRFDKAKRSEIMTKIRSKNTKFEKDFCRELSNFLYPLGYRYRLNAKNIFGKPDIVFTKFKIAIFLDSNFWHGKNFKNWNKKLDKFWTNKIIRNMRRDKEVNRKLRQQGWTVLRFWEAQVQKKQSVIKKKILSHLK